MQSILSLKKGEKVTLCSQITKVISNRGLNYNFWHIEPLKYQISLIYAPN